MTKVDDRLLAAVAPVPAGTIADRFEVLREVGMGGMGTVYLAKDLESGALVAVKVLTDIERGHHERFEREALVLSQLRDPGIVAYVAHGETPDGEAYLAMEWLEGETLARRLESGPLSIAEAIRMARDVASALSAAHRAGVVHRDLKPSNIQIVGDGPTVKVLDFGVARMSGGSRELTKTGEIVGTAGYMAPEQARAAATIDERADLFSLGCVLHRSVTGHPVFDGDSVLMVLAKLVLSDAPLLRERRPEAPVELESLVTRLLEKDPSDRPRSAEDVRDELDRIAADLDGTGPPTMRAGTVSSARPTRRETPTIGCLILASAPDFRLDGPPIDATSIATEAGELGVTLVPLAGGAVAATLPGDLPPEVLAARTARCTQLVASLVTGAAAAVVSAPPTERWPATQLIELAARTLVDAPPGTIRMPGAADARRAEIAGELQRVGLEVEQAREQARDPAPPTLASPLSDASRRTPSTSRRRLLIAVGLVVFVAVLLVGLLVVRGRPDETSASSAPSASAPLAPSAGPPPSWAQAIGGNGGTKAVAVSATNDRTYVAAELQGTVDIGPARHAAIDDRDGVIVAYDGAGNLAWSVGAHGPGAVEIRALAAAADGVHAVGFFHEKISVGGSEASVPGRDGIFVLHLDRAGKVRRLSGHGEEDLNLYLGQVSIAVGPDGAIAIAGGFAGTLDLGCGAKRAEDALDGFVAALDAAGRCLWMNVVGGGGLQALESVGIDLSGQITAAGEIHGMVEVGHRRHESSGGIDVFVARYRKSGEVRWSKSFGNARGLQGSVRGVVEPLGAILLAGWFDGTLDFGGASIESVGEGHDLFVAKLDASGEHTWSRVLSVERPPCKKDRCILDRFGFAADDAGRGLVVFPFAGTARIGATTLTSRGDTDVAVVQLDEQGEPSWAHQLGDDGASCAVPRCVLAAAVGPTSATVAGEFRGALGLGDLRAAEPSAFVLGLPRAL